MPYPADPHRRGDILALLDRVFPGLAPAVRQAQAWGADWFEASTPFVSEAAGQVAGVVGVIELPLRVSGRDRVVAGVHAVCVDPLHRGRGHLRRAMEPALAFVDARYDAVILWAEEPDIYRRWGFRSVTEHAFAADLPPSPGPPRAVTLDPSRPADLARLTAALAARAPVSEASGTRDPGWHFLVALALSSSLHQRVHLLPDVGLGCVVVAAPAEGALRLYDVVAPAIPPLDTILDHLGHAGGRVEVLFTPDRLSAPGLAPIPHPDPGLMVRGDLDPEALGPFAFSLLTRC